MIDFYEAAEVRTKREQFERLLLLITDDGTEQTRRVRAWLEKRLRDIRFHVQLERARMLK